MTLLRKNHDQRPPWGGAASVRSSVAYACRSASVVPKWRRKIGLHLVVLTGSASCSLVTFAKGGLQELQALDLEPDPHLHPPRSVTSSVHGAEAAKIWSPRTLVEPAPEVQVDTFSERQTAEESFSLVRDFGKVDFLAQDFHDREVQAYFAPLAGGFVALAKRFVMYRVMHVVPPVTREDEDRFTSGGGVGKSEFMHNESLGLTKLVEHAVEYLENNVVSKFLQSVPSTSTKIFAKTSATTRTSSTTASNREDERHGPPAAADDYLPSESTIRETLAAIQKILQFRQSGQTDEAKLSSLTARLRGHLAKFETMAWVSEDLAFADFYLFKVASLFDRLAAKVLYSMQEAVKSYEKLYCTEKLRFTNPFLADRFAKDITHGIFVRLGRAGEEIAQAPSYSAEDADARKMQARAAVHGLKDQMVSALKEDLLLADFSLRKNKVLPDHFSLDLRFCPRSELLFRGFLRQAAEMWASSLTDVMDMVDAMLGEVEKLQAAWVKAFAINAEDGAASSATQSPDTSKTGSTTSSTSTTRRLFTEGALTPYFANFDEEAGGQVVQEDFEEFSDFLDPGSTDNKATKIIATAVLSKSRLLIPSSSDAQNFKFSNAAPRPKAHERGLLAVRDLRSDVVPSIDGAEVEELAFEKKSKRILAAFLRLTKTRIVLENADRQKKHLQFLKRMANRIADSLLRSNCLGATFARLVAVPDVHPEYTKRAAADENDATFVSEDEIAFRNATDLARTKLDILEWRALHSFFTMVKQSNVRHLREGKSPISFAQNGQSPHEYTRQWLGVEYDHRELGIEKSFHGALLLGRITADHEHIPVYEPNNGFMSPTMQEAMLRKGHKFNPFLDFVATPNMLGLSTPSKDASSADKFWASSPNVRNERGHRISPRIDIRAREFPRWFSGLQGLFVNGTEAPIPRSDPFMMAPPQDEILPVDDSFLQTVTPLSNLEVRMQCSYPLLRVPSCLLEKDRLRYFGDLVRSHTWHEVLQQAARARWDVSLARFFGNDNELRVGAKTKHKFLGFALQQGIRKDFPEIVERLTAEKDGRENEKQDTERISLLASLDAYQKAASRELMQFEFHDDTCITHYDWVVFLLRKLVAKRQGQTGKGGGHHAQDEKLQTISIGVFLAAVETRVLQDPLLQDKIFFHLVDPWPEGQRNIPGLQDWRTSTTEELGVDACRGDAACAALVVQEIRKKVALLPSEIQAGNIRTDAEKQGFAWEKCENKKEDSRQIISSGVSQMNTISNSRILDYCNYVRDYRVDTLLHNTNANGLDHSTEDWCIAQGLSTTAAPGAPVESSPCHQRMKPVAAAEEMNQESKNAEQKIVEKITIGQEKLVSSRGDPLHFQVLQEYAQDVHQHFADNSADFIFVDGDHSEAGVRSDLEYYFWKVKKPGGILAGHDLGLFTFPGMAHGVLGFFHELLNGYCGVLALEQDKEDAEARNSDVVRRDKNSTQDLHSFRRYCNTGLTMHVVSDYVYWVQF